MRKIFNKTLFSGNRDDGVRSFQLFSVLRYAGLLLSSVVLARWFPNQELLAHYEKLLLLGASTSFFWLSGMLDGFLVLFRKAEGRDEGLFRDTFQLIAGFSFLAAGTVVLLGGFFLSENLPWAELIPFAVFSLLDNLAFPLVYHLLGRRKGKELLAYGAFAYGGYALVVLLVLGSGLGLSLALWALTGLAMVKVVWMLYATRKIMWINSEGRFFKPLLAIGGPLAAAALLSHSASYVDAYLVERFFQNDFVNFRYGAKELPLALLLANSLSVAMSGNIAGAMARKNLQEGLSQLKAASLRLMHILFPLSALFLLISTYVFTAILGEAFTGAVPVFDIYLLLLLPRLLFPQSVLRGLEKTKLMTLSALVELILNVCLSLLGMYFFGLVGIAGATVVAYFVDKLLLLYFCKSRFNLDWSSYTPVKWWVLYSLGLVLLWVVKFQWGYGVVF